MQRNAYLFTSESVSEGHPDKICDRISDAVVDHFLSLDTHAKVACETLATTNRVVLAGEVRSQVEVPSADLEEIARRVVRDIGYEQEGFDWRTFTFENHLHEQSADIYQGVGEDEGAGDQGIMFGYACRETPELTPAPIHYCHRILQALAEARRSGAVTELGPDAKSQVTLRYEDGKPRGAHSIVVSTQHLEGVSEARVREIVRSYVEEVLPPGWMCPEENFYVNPTGRFVIGGPDGDAGLTGRKIIVDTYGGAAPHGGGAFSGKDPSKVDRSAAYAARYLAKNIVAAGLADRCAIQLSYAIGVAHPLSIHCELYCTGRIEEARLEEALPEIMDLTPKGIRDHLQLRRPIYERTAAYGHFGRKPEPDGGFSWERTDLVERLKEVLG